MVEYRNLYFSFGLGCKSLGAKSFVVTRILDVRFNLGIMPFRCGHESRAENKKVDRYHRPTFG